MNFVIGFITSFVINSTAFTQIDSRVDLILPNIDNFLNLPRTGSGGDTFWYRPGPSHAGISFIGGSGYAASDSDSLLACIEVTNTSEFILLMKDGGEYSDDFSLLFPSLQIAERVSEYSHEVYDVTNVQFEGYTNAHGTLIDFDKLPKNQIHCELTAGRSENRLHGAMNCFDIYPDEEGMSINYSLQFYCDIVTTQRE